MGIVRPTQLTTLVNKQAPHINNCNHRLHLFSRGAPQTSAAEHDDIDVRVSRLHQLTHARTPLPHRLSPPESRLVRRKPIPATVVLLPSRLDSRSVPLPILSPCASTGADASFPAIPLAPLARAYVRAVIRRLWWRRGGGATLKQDLEVVVVGVVGARGRGRCGNGTSVAGSWREHKIDARALGRRHCLGRGAWSEGEGLRSRGGLQVCDGGWAWWEE
ncbi:hypothetical protein R3P38DRAFT_2764025 [Favolaschia claudopus]|uniref:Uncharacterized protein n=1 Tax=Favolaschia claudopus TaxID=2862362 RepID=A0AAW0DIU2_9AGAR